MKHLLRTTKRLTNLLTLATLLALPGIGWGQTTIAVQDFEDTPAAPTWSYSATGGGTNTTANKYNGAKSYRLESSQTLTMNNIDISGYTSVVLLVAFAAAGPDSGEDLFMDISYDNGTTWTGSGSIKLVDGYSNTPIDINTTNASNPTTVGSNPWPTNIGASETQIRVRFRCISLDEFEYYFIDDVKLTGIASTGPANPASFAAITSSASQINLTATANANTDDIVVVYNSSGTFTAPTNGSAPTAVGTPLEGSGGTIVYAGSAASLSSHTGLTANTVYYYKAFSYDGSNNYSNGLTANATTAKIEPTNQVTNFTKGTLTTTTLPLTWTAAVAGSQLPDGYLLKLNTGSITDPVDGTDPGAGSLSISSGAASYKVTSAATTTATFTSAIAGTMYNVKIYSYTNSGSLIDFNTTSVPTVNFATLPAAVTSPSLSVTGSTTSNITWTLPGSYIAGNHSTLVFVKQGSAVTAGTPTNAPSAYTANTAFLSGTVYQGDAAAYCVYNGDGTSVSVTGLTGNTTYHILIYTVVDASNSDVTNSYSAGATASGTTSKIEPSNQPTAYAVGAVTTANIPLSWVAAVAGSQAPDGYLIKLNTSTVVDPVDGTDPSDVTNVSGGFGNRKVTSGTSYSGFTSWTAGTMYNFKIYSYTNSGTNINFNLNSPPSINHATLPGNVTATSFTATGTTTANISWTLPGTYNNGNHSTLVFVKSAGSITAGTPTNAPSVYSANTAFGAGTQYQNDVNAFCVFNGDGTSVSITGLTANTTYYALIYTVVDASNSNSTNSYSASASPNGSTAKIEPENQVTNFAVGGVTTSSIPINWTAAVAGSQLPDGYLIKLSTAPISVVDPVDGTDPSNVTAITGGLANKETTPGSASSATSFTNMVAGTMYNYRIYSYTNSGSLINFNLTSPPALNHATLPAVVTGATFAATESTTANISWTQPGTYSSINHSTLVFVKATSAVTQLTPTNAPSTYTANTTFGSGTAYQNDGLASCVYNGDGTSVSITGLTANTTYHILIYTVVDASNSNSTNSYSAATTANGTTLKTPVSVPYSQDFESSTTEWTLATTGTNKWAIGSATNNGGSKGLYISNDNGTSNAYTNTVTQTGTDASFRVDLTGLTAASMTFDWKANGEVGYDYGEVYVNTGVSDVLISETEEFISTTSFANRRISLTPYVGSNVTIKFRWVNDYLYGNQPPFSVDNVTVADGDVATLTTTSVSSISVNSAVTGGEISNGGGSSVTARGVVYGTSANPTLANSFTSDGTGTGNFTSNLSGLVDNTTYYVRAYATNSTGTAYGNEYSFTTSSVAAPVANAASATGATGFTANWGAVEGANSYKLDVSTIEAFGTEVNATDLLISEYVEGSSSNKAIEIFNGTGSAINLSSYSLKRQTNGEGTFGDELLLSGIIQNNSTYVIVNSSAGPTLSALADLSTGSGVVQFNGNDAVALYKLGVQIDVVGVVNSSSNWGEDMTLVRKSSITGPTTTYNQSGDWTQYSTDYFTNVGTHTFNGFTPSMLSGYDDLNVSGTSQVVEGLTPNSTYYYRVRAVGTNNTSANSNVITVTTGVSKVSAGDGDWNSITWSPAGTPVAQDEVTIDHAVTLAGNADCHNLTIGAGSLTIESGGSIITSGTASGSVTCERYMPAVTTWPGSNDGWHFISSPVTAQSISGNWTPSGENNNYDFYAWEESNVATPWLNQKEGANGISAFVPGKGYLVAYQVAGTKEFTGTLNSGDVSFNLKKSGAKSWTYESGYNLIGNPYPSGIDWNLANHSQFQDVFAYVYTGNGYTTVDGSEEDAFIAANQGFFVLSEVNNQNFIFTDAIRVHGGSYLKSGNPDNKFVIRLADEAHSDYTTIRLREQSTPQRDRLDALKFLSFNPEMPQVYSRTAEGINVAVNSIPGNGEVQSISLPIYAPANQTMTLSIENAEGMFGNQPVYLHDQLTGIEQNLSSNPVYSFTATQGDDESRFTLHFSTVGISTPETTSIQVYTLEGKVYVNGAPANAQFSLTDITGRMVQRVQLGNSGLNTVNVSNLPHGVYVVTVNDGKHLVSHKIIL